MSDGRRTRIGAAALACIPILAVAALVGAPLGAVLWRASGAVAVDSDGATLRTGQLAWAIVRTLAATGVISLLAVVLAAPVGWALRGARMRLLGALVIVPMLMPNYFAYAGWSMLRAPRTYLGDWLADAPAWVSIWAGPVIGVAGLALWSWPLAAMVIGTAARRIDREVLDALDLDGAGAWQRPRIIARMLAPALTGAFLLVVLVMMGSMVPLDVANVETYSVLLLRWLNLHPSDVPVWRASWPLMLLAAAATVLILRATAGDSSVGGDAGGESPRRRRGRRALLAWVGAVWTLAVVAPGVLYVMNLREPPHAATWETIRRFMGAFWRDSGPAAAASAGVAARVGVISMMVGAGVWYAGSRGHGGRRTGGTAALTAGILLAAGLMPGVLVGTAVRRAGDMMTPSMGDSTWMVVWAHLARFAFIAAVMGLWLARTESREERSLRLMDGGDTPRGFARACLARHWPVIVGAGLATAILSFHEIEATVMVWPPGTRNLAQELLDALHFARDERLAAAAVNLMGVGGVLAYFAAWMVLGGGRGRGAEGKAKNGKWEDGKR